MADEQLYDILNFQSDSLPATVTNVSNVYPVDLDSVGANQVQVRINQTMDTGTYIIGISSTATINSTGNSVQMRFTLDSGGFWEQGQKEAKDPTDRLFADYSFPYTHGGGLLDFAVQIKKENATNNLDVFFANIWLMRVK